MSRSSESAVTDLAAATPWCELVAELQSFFGCQFSLWDAGTGQLLHGSEGQPVGDRLIFAGLVGAVDRRQQACFLVEEDGLLALAIPFGSELQKHVVATAWFMTRDVGPGENLAAAARLLDVSVDQLRSWLPSQERWSAGALLRLAEAVRGTLGRRPHGRSLPDHDQPTLSRTDHRGDEFRLVHALAQHLRISNTEREISRLATTWLSECLPAEGFAVQYLPVAGDGPDAGRAARSPEFQTAGRCPIDSEEFVELIAQVGLQDGGSTYLAGDGITNQATWPFAGIRQLMIVPLTEGNKQFGWLAAFNHRNGSEFSSDDTQLMNSLAALLAIHSSNRLLYREQAEFVASVVRALVSAIDAKDPYTSGHSDRVSRVAVRIALELRCSPKALNTICLAGLLHDVGKIGIDDNVLRKTERLTDDEFEHVKRHPEMGYRILADLKQLADVLPAVLHHHEQWDGGGYPHGLKGEETPLIARIMAVADAYDAMTSDRPYRRGMSEDQVDQVFREGTGRQWDAKVVAAFFAAKEDIVAIATRDRSQREEKAS